MKKPKVAIFHCGFIYSGGGERIVLEEARGLRKRGYHVEVFAPTLDKKLCFPEFVKELNVKTFLPQLPVFIPARFAIQMVLSSILAPFLAFRFSRSDIFIGANQPGAWIAYCVSKFLRKPYVVYMNQPNRLLYPRKIDLEVKWQNLKEYYFIDGLIKKLKIFVSWADRASFTKSHVILENGDYIGEVIKKIYKKEVVACPAGTYINALSKTSSKNFIIKNLREKAFKIKKPYILLTNRHVPQKRFEYGIEALELVLKRFKNIMLVVPGPFTTYTVELIGLAGKLNIKEKVLFTGQVEESVLQKLYKEADVYVYTAPDEDFGMGIIEAMSWGVPVVAWNYAGPSTTVVDGVTGYLAKPYNIDNFGQKILSILENPKKRKEMGKNARKHVQKNFSWGKHIDVLEKTIVGALKNKQISLNKMINYQFSNN